MKILIDGKIIAGFLFTFLFGVINPIPDANAHGHVFIFGDSINVLPVAGCSAGLEAGETPRCVRYIVEKGDTLSHLALRYGTKEYRISVKDILATGYNRVEIAKRVTPRLKKISSEEGHWIFERQVILLPFVTETEIAAANKVKQAAEATAKKSVEEAAAQARKAVIEKFWRDILTVAIIATFLVLIYVCIMLYRQEKQSSAPRTPEERERMINDPSWKKDDPEKNDKNKKPSDWDYVDYIFLIGFSFFAFAANAHAGEITDLNDPENPLLIALIILILFLYLPSLLNFLLTVLSSKLDLLEKESSQRRPPSRQQIDVSSNNSIKAKVIPLFRNRH